jgi:hypothetical protein
MIFFIFSALNKNNPTTTFARAVSPLISDGIGGVCNDKFHGDFLFYLTFEWP